MEDLSRIFSNFPFVSSYEILKFERTRSVLRLKVAVAINDGSQLFLSEATTPRGFRYAYHWQDAEGRMLARWDNAPHHQTLVTFPDHFHTAENIEPAVQPTIREVFEYLANRLRNRPAGEAIGKPT